MAWQIDKVDTLGEFYRKAEANPYSGSGGAEWIGTRSMAEAIQLATDGWREIRPTVDALSADIMATVRDTVDLTHVPTLDIAGAAIDMGEYMTGVPECMIAFPTDPNPTIDRTLRVVMDPGASSGHSAAAIAKRGAAVACLLECLQVLGYSLEIWVASPVKYRGGIYSPLVRANHAGEQVDIDGLMFACGHPSMLRRMFFSHRHAHGVDGSMGVTVALNAEALGMDADMLIQRSENRAAGEPDSEWHPAEWVVWALRHLGVTE